jgi:hypothetical protein
VAGITDGATDADPVPALVTLVQAADQSTIAGQEPISEIGVRHFKRVADTSIPLTGITVLVGGNNSGKTTVLQAAHFGVALLQTSVRFGPNFAPSAVLYAPTEDIFDVAHGERLSDTPIEIIYSVDTEATRERFTVRLTASSDGAVSVSSEGPDDLFRRLSDVQNLFSIYVPGLAGIPAREEYHSHGVVKNGIARGDANLFLRNVLLRIKQDATKWGRLQSMIASVFSESSVEVTFNEEQDSTIDARFKFGDLSIPLDMAGTGVLQFLQIAAYTVNYEPALLLLDEPDSHLHPSNQRLIAQALVRIAEGTTRVLIATHSRTMLDALQDRNVASFLWLEHGEVHKERDKGRLAMLLALGALDGAERVYHGNYRLVIFTEDTDKKHRYLRAILEANGFSHEDILIKSYNGSSEFNAASLLTEFIKDIRPGIEVLVHRDRDFMTDEELQTIEAKFEKSGVSLLIPDGSDIEARFASPEHIAETTNLSFDDANALVDEVIKENAVAITRRYTNKRTEIKTSFYKGHTKDCPSVDTLMPGDILLPHHAVGKELFGWIANALETRRLAQGSALVRPSKALEHNTLKRVAVRIYGGAHRPPDTAEHEAGAASLAAVEGQNDG